MGHANSTELDAYFGEAASWDMDRAAQTARLLRVAVAVAIAGWLCAVCVSLAVVLMMPLKKTVPYVIRVDNTTGIVDVVPTYDGRADVNETVTRFLLTYYITTCESFIYESAQRDYEVCGAFQSANRNSEWYAQWNTANPMSPLNQFKDGTSVHAQVVSISFFRRHDSTALAQVRYTRGTQPPGGTEVIMHWIATIEYAYGTPSKDVRMRQYNPLGFRVIEFRREAEAASNATTLSDPTPRGSANP